jgi:Raf kinase inhibitor-like YbhB/YbcL family protein
MKLASTSFDDGGAIPPRFAFGAFDATTHVRLSQNRNPDLSWSELPQGTKSLVLICHDPDVPSKGDDVNKEGRIVPASLARVDFFHWVLVELPADSPAIKEGEFSDGVTGRGKDGPQGARGTRQGINDYTNWFAGDSDMGGKYFGYDGPCPPWNDEMVHRYVFTLYALDLDRCPLEGIFTGRDVLTVIEGHVLDKASWTGTYSLNPNTRG